MIQAPQPRLLLVSNTMPPRDLSGVGEQVTQLVAHLREQGWDVTVAQRGEAGPGVLRVPGPKLLFPLAAAAAALPALVRGEFDLVQVHESDGALVALAARLTASLSRRRRIVVTYFQVSYAEEMRHVATVRTPAGVAIRPVFAERVFKWLLAPWHVALGMLSGRLADLVLAPSRVTLAEVQRDYALAGTPGEVLPNCTRHVGSGGAAPAYLRERQEQTDRRPLFLYAGRLRARKGVEVLLLAVAELYRRGHQPVLVVAGDGENRRALERLAAWLGLAGAVRFAGRVGQGELGHYMHATRALVVPSLYEGMPLVILEGMAQGAAIIASRVSGIPEVVEDGVTGTLVPALDHLALAGAMERLLRDPGLGQRYGEAGRRAVRERYDRAVVGARLERIYESLLADPR